MGAMEPLRWHSWHLAWKMGATSLVNVTGFSVNAAAIKDPAATNKPPHAGTATFRIPLMIPLLQPTWPVYLSGGRLSIPSRAPKSVSLRYLVSIELSVLLQPPAKTRTLRV